MSDDPAIEYLGGNKFAWKWKDKAGTFEVGFFMPENLAEIYPKLRKWAAEQYELFHGQK